MNLSASTRRAIYLVIGVLSPSIAYLNTEGVVSDMWAGLFAVVVSAVSALAFSKVTPDGK